MKAFALALLFIFCYVECRKVLAPIDKNVNLAFINMEAGGMRAGSNMRPANANQVPAPAAPTPTPVPKPINVVPEPKPTLKPVAPTTIKAVPAAKPVQPTPAPNQIKPVPVNPSPVAKPITTPGPGSVKQLINFYDSQGKASPIRPYSYSQAVKQG
ncbi:unnamed protein product [Parnassius apollo]|uniref:(apollo) hypothetical protein n=1 Tax=Parnassius apollo TaxID=110799 RepID=A0A8S3WS33_PARAO|nr:unnamed protein product [Parnassius apollo]